MLDNIDYKSLFLHVYFFKTMFTRNLSSNETKHFFFVECNDLKCIFCNSISIKNCHRIMKRTVNAEHRLRHTEYLTTAKLLVCLKGKIK